MSRAWRHSHGWLTTIKSNSSRNRELAKRKFFLHNHAVALADPRLKEEQLVFLSWQANLRIWMLDHNTTVEALRANVGAAADRMETEAVSRAQAHFMTWVQDGRERLWPTTQHVEDRKRMDSEQVDAGGG